jgi:RimJ/RimL family protein N-acetyltransferase
MKDIFRGNLVRLASENPDTLAKLEVRWQYDSELLRLTDNEAIYMVSEKRLKDKFEKSAEDGFKADKFSFSIRSLDGDQVIGYLIMRWDLIHNDVMVGIGIGERDLWGKGFGTEAMRLCLQFAFLELNVHRVSLGLHEYNARALRSYEKAGFRLEGQTRKDLAREGRRYDSLWMGILRDEWLQLQGGGDS